MNEIAGLIKAARRIHAQQRLMNAAAILTFLAAVAVLILLVSLFLFRSPWYGLLALGVLLFCRPTSFMDQVRVIDRRCGLNGRLINCLQLANYTPAGREGYSQELVAAYIEHAVAEIDPEQFKNALDRKPLSTGIQILLLSIVLFLLYPVFLPARFAYSINRRIEWVIFPGDRNSVENADQRLSIILNGLYIPGRVRLVTRHGDKRNCIPVKVENNEARASLIVKNSFTYHFEFLGKTTAASQITMIMPMHITDLKFDLVYPSYTGLEPEIKTGRQIIAPQNTRIIVTGHANQDITGAWLVLSDTLPMTFQDNIFKGEFVIRQSGTAFIKLKGTSVLREGITIYAIPDLPPLVELFLPGQNINMPDGMMLDIGIRISDDYGIGKGIFCHQMDHPFTRNLKLRIGDTEDTVFFKWNLADLNMLPGDEVSYYVEVSDNAGNATRSNTYYVYFPTMEQMYEAIHREEDELAGMLDRSIEEQYTNADELERIEQNLMKNREISWADQEKLRELMKRDEDLLERIEEWQDELERTIDKLNEGVVLDPKALSNLQELLELLNEIAPQELREALETIQRQFNENPRKMENAFKDFKEHQEELTRALERTLEILKRYQQEEKLRQLAETARDLADEADSLLSAGHNKDDQALRDLQDRIKQLASETAELSASPGLEDSIKNELSDIAGQLESTALEETMQSIRENISMSAAELESLYEKLVKGRGGQLQAKLYELLGQLIAISQTEEELLTDYGKQQFDPRHQDQIVRSTKAVAESLFSEEKRSLYVTPTMGKRIARAADLMAEARAGSDYRNNIQEAIRSINQVGVELLKNLEQVSSGKSSTGADQIMEQLSKVSQGQLSINQSTSSLFPLPVTGMSPAMKEQMERLAGSQQKLRQSLSGLQQQAGSEPYQDLLKKLSQDMQSVEEDLFQYKLDRELIERQQQILTRLLDAEKSIRRENYDEKRKSRTGRDFVVESPPLLPERLGKNKLRDLINQALKEPYPEEYEIYIRKYFEQLPDLEQ